MAIRVRIDPLRAAAAAVPYLPIAVLPVLGLLWLLEKSALWPWVVSLLTCAAIGSVSTIWLSHRNRKIVALSASGPETSWAPREVEVWSKVDALAEAAALKDWPLKDLPRWIDLGRHVVEVVAKHYHSNSSQPILEISIPHMLRLIELAARDLGRDVRENIPLSDRVTLGDLLGGARLKPFADSALALLRVGRFIVNPTSAVSREVEGILKDQLMAVGQDELHRSLLQEYVRRVGRYAIELYSGTLRFEDDDPLERLSAATIADLDTARDSQTEPLRILVLGRTNAGKSSLINALFGKLIAAADIVPTTSRLTPYELELAGAERLIVTDSPGLETLTQDDLRSAACGADMIIWVCSANRADRAADRRGLDMVRADLLADPSRKPPPIIITLSHIDQLRPFNDWSPPYDLGDLSNAKSQSICASLEAVSGDLDVDPELIVPVCLEPKRLYNVDDTLWVAILSNLGEAARVRLLRCLDTARSQEKRSLMMKQVANTGRLLLKLPGVIANRSSDSTRS